MIFHNPLKYILLIATFFALSFAATGQNITVPQDSTSTPDDEEDPYFLLCGQADEAIAKGDYESAAARLIDAMAVKPDSPSNLLLMSNLGMIYSYLDKDSLALETLNEAHRQAPAMKTILSNRAYVLLKLGRKEEAVKDLDTVIASDSLNTDARYFRGMISLYSGKMQQAEADFTVLKNIIPESLNTATALSTLYSMTGRDNLAIPYFKKLIKYEPAPEYYSALAGCYIATDALTEASETISDGMAAYPDDPELYYYRAMLNRERFRPEDAQKDAQRAIELGASPHKVKALFKSNKKSE